MPEYTVRWEIEIDADSPEEAARMALEIQRDPRSTALVFDVINNDWGGGDFLMIDLAGES